MCCALLNAERNVNTQFLRLLSLDSSAFWLIGQQSLANRDTGCLSVIVYRGSDKNKVLDVFDFYGSATNHLGVGVWVGLSVPKQRGCCIRSPLATKLLHVLLFLEDNTQRDLKNSSPWYTCDLSLHQV